MTKRVATVILKLRIPIEENEETKELIIKKALDDLKSRKRWNYLKKVTIRVGNEDEYLSGTTPFAVLDCYLNIRDTYLKGNELSKMRRANAQKI